MVIIDLFNIKSFIGSALMGMLFVVYPFTTALFAYMFTSWPYMFCFLLNVLAVSLLEKHRDLAHLTMGMLIISLALGIYQAMFFSVHRY